MYLVHVLVAPGVFSQMFIHDYTVLAANPSQQRDPLSNPSPILQQLRASAPVVEVTVSPDDLIKSAATHYKSVLITVPIPRSAEYSI